MSESNRLQLYKLFSVVSTTVFAALWRLTGLVESFGFQAASRPKKKDARSQRRVLESEETATQVVGKHTDYAGGRSLICAIKLASQMSRGHELF